jgi:NAD(P)-dependent dehydrogenase (short-subunit alcohol dehydrogenase family)
MNAMNLNGDAASEAARMREWDLRRFEGRIALVTGGASGIGRATVLRLAAEGAQVWILDRNAPPKGDPVLDVATFVPLDVTDHVAVDASIDNILAKDGRLDVAVNAAGIAIAGTVTETTITEWSRTIAVNLTGTFHITARAMHAMRDRGGAIVNIASDAGLVGQQAQAAYCASKGGVVQFTRAAALDGAPDAIRVNCVCPCFVETPLVQEWIAAQPNPAAARAAAEADQPIGRMGQPHEIAAAVAFLASDEANFITGTALAVDGGTTAR